MSDKMINDPAHEPLIDGSEPRAPPKRYNIRNLLKIGGIICVLSVITVSVSLISTSKQWSAMAPGFKDAVKLNDIHRKISFKSLSSFKDYLEMKFPHKLRSSWYSEKLPECESNPKNGNVVQNTSSTCSPKLNMEFENNLHAVIYEDDLDGLTCHVVEWQTNDTSQEISNCLVSPVDPSGYHNWYAAGGMTAHMWPLGYSQIEFQAHITQESKFREVPAYIYDIDKRYVNRYYYDRNTHMSYLRFGSFLEPYFLTSNGIAIQVEPFLPLFISFNQNSNDLCLKVEYTGQYTPKEFPKKLLLKYLVCKDSTATAVHQRMLRTGRIPFNHNTPNIEILQKPIWSTRGLDPNSVNETTVSAMIQHIKSNNLRCGHLFIDGNYSAESGVFYFSETKFPKLFKRLTLNSSKGEEIPIGIEVYPYVPREKSNMFGVQYKNSSVPRFNKDGPFFLDLTNQEAVEYYKSHLKNVTQVGDLKGFRFSGGFAMDVIAGLHESFLVTKGKLENPNSYTNMYAQIASEFKGSVLMGSGYRSQSQTFIADAGRFNSKWNGERSLEDIIPTVLTYGIMGYPFCMIGPVEEQNVYGSVKPDKELYIRRLQLLTYLPVMEISGGPWVYDQNVLDYTKSLLDRRYKELWPKYFAPAVDEAVKFGYPIIRPLWWIAPDDKMTYGVQDQFMLGDKLLVAPKLTQNDDGIYVYLPAGSKWRDVILGDLHEGGNRLYKKVSLYEIVTFERETF